MSKKWKKKLIKQQKATILQQTQVTTSSNSTAIEVAPDEKDLLPEVAPKVSRKVAKWQAQHEESPQNPANLLPEVTRVKHDIKKISILVLSIIILLIAGTILDQKIGWILKAADFLFGKFNFS